MLKYISKIKYLCTSFCLVCLFPYFGYAQQNTGSKRTAVFGITDNNSVGFAVTREAVDYSKKIFNECGRFMPVEDRQLGLAYEEAKKLSPSNIYNETARLLNLDLYVLVTAYQIGDMIYSDLEVVPVNNKYESLKRRYELKTRIKLNVPLKVGREIALLHRDLPLRTKVLESYGKGNYLIDAGEWDGIRNNDTYRFPEFNIQVVRAGRYESLVKSDMVKSVGDEIIINIFPDIDKIIAEQEKDISRNTINRYRLENISGGDPEKRLLEGICLVNLGSNICIPGYGAFLSTNYLGLKNTRPDIGSVVVSGTAIGMHFLLPEIITNFKINFFPWEQDPDKTDSMQNLQIFFWLSLPLTFSAAYLDQLTFQFKNTMHLPPFFSDRDNMAAALSFFIPGGGFFYKGQRLQAWVFYFSEMTLAGYSVYNYNKSNTGYYALYALAGLKAIDIIYSYFIKPAYSFYNMEIGTGKGASFLDIDIRTGPGNDNIFNIMVSTRL